MSEDQDHFHETSGNVSVEWKIRNFKRRMKNGSRIQSPKFFLSDAHFSILIYSEYESLQGRTFAISLNAKQNETRWVSLHLWLVNSRFVHRIEYTIRLKDSDGFVLVSRDGNHTFPPGGQGINWARLLEISEIEEKDDTDFDGTLTVIWKGRVAGPKPQAVSNTLGTLSMDFEKFFANGFQTDTVINVKGKKFSAHRSILSARSSVFRSMFESDMREKETGDVNIIDCDAKSFRAFLLFLYSGKIDEVTSENALDLYATANKYDVQNLKEECCEILSRGLSVDSVCDVLRLTEFHQEQKLLNSATEYFLKNASEILRTEKWQFLSGENPTLANDLFIKLADIHVDKSTTLVNEIPPEITTISGETRACKILTFGSICK